MNTRVGNISESGASIAAPKPYTPSAASALSVDMQHSEHRMQIEDFTPTYSTNGASRLSNHATYEFYERYKTIYEMTRLPEDHPYYLPDDIAQHAKDCLASLANNSYIEPPQLLNRGGEALSLTWRSIDGKIYLTIDETDVDVLEIGEESRKSTNLTENGEFNWRDFLDIMGSSFSSYVSK